MPNLILPPAWQGREQDATPKHVYDNRRAVIKALGLGAIGGAAGLLSACSGDQSRAALGKDTTRAAATQQSTAPPDGPLDTIPANAPRTGLPAERNERFTVDRATTPRLKASSYNNFYEFKNQGELKDVWPLTGTYEPFPWTIDVRGAVESEFTLDVDQLIGEMALEERLYRFRCVEAWAMTVPWTGFPLSKLLLRCKPLSKAKYVRFVCADRPQQMPGLKKATWYPWPYFEALRMDEATNELAFVVTGMYGESLPKQNGAPLRLALPWKYGYKGPKAFVRIEFVEEQPETFWHALNPDEYGFLSNVNPNIPHPRWSQATEDLIGTEKEEQVPTQLFNGYGEYVADLYPDEPRAPTKPMAR